MEQNQNKIPLWIAIFININVIVGAAFFLGAAEVSQKSGMLGPISWMIWGLIIFPIVLAFAKLSNFYPEAGGIYIYPKKELGDFWGFVAGWGYFIATISGNAIIMHKFAIRFSELFFPTFIKNLDPNCLIFDFLLITFFSLFNLANINFLENVQIIFTILKSIPLFFVVISGFYLFNLNNITSAPLNYHGFFESIPLVIFAYMGFEVCCAITHQIKDGEKNASKAILISFGLIMAIYAILQFFLLAIHGSQTTFPFLEIFPKLTNNQTIITIGNIIIDSAIMSSFLAGYYGLFYGNNWVLYALAKEKSLPFNKQLTKLNIYKTPWICVILQGLLTFGFLLITQDTLYLISMSDFAIIIAYILGSISFVAILLRTKNTKNLILGILAILSCSYFMYICIKELAESGFQYLIPFLIILGFGLLLNKMKRK
ncbi:amino acid permease [Candidatus Dependentiae bacterium]|nr:amino acid permease [Candidatus Dependentiae bacterium]